MKYKIIYNGPQIVAISPTTYVESFDKLRKWTLAFVEMSGDPKHLEIWRVQETPFSQKDIQALAKGEWYIKNGDKTFER